LHPNQKNLSILFSPALLYPGGVGHAWFRTMFIVSFQAGTEADTRFISAKCSDNRFNNPGYQKTLDNLYGWQKRAWRDGD